MAALLAELTDRERDIVKRRFGLAEIDAVATLEEIGTQFKVTRERVRQVIKGALDKLRTNYARYDDVVRFTRVVEQLLL